MEKLAFVGLGLMGTPMATRLLEAGNDLTVWNRTAEKTRPLADRGASVASTPAAGPWASGRRSPWSPTRRRWSR
jgi:3-hydroxyisobutyrate dehydrogenase-like beta-hydroxyacid dehydrogenase